MNFNAGTVEQSYLEIKDHFMQRFATLDREFAVKKQHRRDSEDEIQIVQGFAKEGIGALLAYLPADVACSTIKDFLKILEPQALQLAEERRAEAKAAAEREARLAQQRAVKPRKSTSAAIAQTQPGILDNEPPLITLT